MLKPLRPLLLAVLVTVTGSVMTALSSAPAVAGGAATVIRHVRPVDGSGAPGAGYRIRKAYPHASCAGSSEAIGDAYRCFAGNVVLDPCWVQHDRHFVTCLAKPWRHAAVRVHVTKGYASAGKLSPADGRRHPWGVRTAVVTTVGKPLRCLKTQGASSQVGNRSITYYCGHGYVLEGGLDQSSQEWTAHLAHRAISGDYVPAGTIGLTQAWVGKQSLRG